MQIKIMRGIPGAGKSTYVANLVGNVEKCSADDYFMLNGKYKWNPIRLGDAHGRCMRKFIEICQKPDKVDVLVVDNTNLSVDAIAPYYHVATAYWHDDIEIVTIDVDPTIAAGRNVHGVPVNKVMSMHNQLVAGQRQFPSRWKHTIVVQSPF